MIPWFVVTALGWIAERFGYGSYVRAKSPGWGAERIYFVKGGGRCSKIKQR